MKARNQDVWAGSGYPELGEGVGRLKVTGSRISEIFKITVDESQSRHCLLHPREGGAWQKSRPWMFVSVTFKNCRNF